MVKRSIPPQSVHVVAKPDLAGRSIIVFKVCKASRAIKPYKNYTKPPDAADPTPAPPDPIQSQVLAYFGSSLKGSADLDSDAARRNGGFALPFSKEEDRYDHNHRCLQGPYTCPAWAYICGQVTRV